MVFMFLFVCTLRNSQPWKSAKHILQKSAKLKSVNTSQKAGSLKMNTALEYSKRVVHEGGRRCKKSTLNDLVHLTPLRIPLMNPPKVINTIAGEHIPGSIKLNNVYARYRIDSGQKSPAIFRHLKSVNQNFLKVDGNEKVRGSGFFLYQFCCRH